MRRLPHLCVLLLVQLVAGCSRCGKNAPAPAPPTSIRRYLPRVAELLVVAPNLARLGAKLKQLEGLKLSSFVAQLQGFPSAEAYVGGVMEQLGVDLRSGEDLARAGIDSERGAGLAIVSANRGYLVIAVADGARFRETARRLANKRLGAEIETTREELGHSVTYFARPGESGFALAVVMVEGFALVATGESLQELPGDASLSLPESLADAQSFSGALARLPASADIYVHAPTTSRIAAYCGRADCTFSAELTPEYLRVRADLPSQHSASALGLLEENNGPNLTPYLPSDAFLVARFSGAPLSLSAVWPKLVGAQVAAAIERSGIDLKSELLSNIEPGVVASLSIAPTASFSEMPALDIRQTNPFKFVHLVALTGVKSPGKADELLSKLPALAPRLGAKIESAQRQGRKAFLTSYAQGEGVDFARVDEKVVVAAPLQRLDETVARLTRAGEGGSEALADADLQKVLMGKPIAAVLDFAALAKAIRNLPASAWGIGGFAIKATTLRWLDAMDDLRAITAGAYAKDGAVQLEVDLRFLKR
jgi:hypothetical protein